MTRDAAYQQFEEASKGSIAPGKRADLVILDRDPLILDPTDLLRVQIDETISRGNIVYRRQANPASD
jgi:predicted amidohydrolase YtcJ